MTFLLEENEDLISEAYQSLKSLKDKTENNLPEEKRFSLLNKERIENKAKKDVPTPKNFNRIQYSKIPIRKRKNPKTGCVGVKEKK